MSRRREPTRPSIIEFIEDRRLFGNVFLSPTWGPWKTVLRAIYGLPLGPKQREFFCSATGRSRYEPPPGGWPEVVIVSGARGGKSSIAAAVAAYEAAFPLRLPRVGDAYSVLVAQDQRSSLRTLLSYARAPFQTSDVLRATVASDANDALRLTTGVRLAAYPCRPAAVRGLTAVVFVADELAFFQSTEGNPTDLEMLRVGRSRVATTGGKVLVLSSPYAQYGALYDLHARHYGRDDSATLVVQADAPRLNPTLPADYLARMEQDDPEAYRSEVLGEFRAGVSTLLDPAALDACVDHVCRERRPDDGVRYRAFADAATGGGRDKFTLAVGHAQRVGGRDVAVLDCVRAWSPPFDPNAAIREASALCKQYRVRRVTGDAFAGGSEGGFVESAFRSCGVEYEVSELDRSQIYLEFLPLVNANEVLLLNQPEMLRELRGLERRRGSSGRGRVDHRRGAHDDLANAAAGVMVAVSAARRKRPGFFVIGSVAKSTDGRVWVGNELVAAARSARASDTGPWVHPAERREPFYPDAMSARKRRAWLGGVTA